MALRVVETVEEVAPDQHPATRRLGAMLAALADATADAAAGVVRHDEDATEADLVDQLALLERLRGAVAALQAATMVTFTRLRVERETAAGQRPEAVGRGVAEEVALACRTSPTVAARRLSSARAWWADLPRTYAALAVGRISDHAADLVVAETRHLDGPTRRAVDARLHAADLTGRGVSETAMLARRYAYEADREAYVARGRHDRRHRRVGLRPAPDTMSLLSGYLPVEQGVACLAALRRETDQQVAGGDDRTGDQIMADTLVERLTGQTRATDVPVEIQLVVPVEALGLTSTRTGLVAGGTPLPSSLVHEVVDASVAPKQVRLLHRSEAGQLVAVDRRRRFTGRLADLLAARDQTCREPFCDAPVRHLDHVQRHADGGPTTLGNGRGVCARHNLVREHTGWCAVVVHDGLGTGADAAPHTVRTTTPTGHAYVARAPDPP